MISARHRLANVRQRLVADPQLRSQLEHVAYSIGALHAVAARQAMSMSDAEFRCYSQFGEDGIIQWLIARVPIEREIFVEFGVGDYAESNTRFLLEHDGWAGLILDSGDAHLKFLALGDLLWRHTIEARREFITRVNINELLASVEGDIGLLSIDLDGNDYWVWESLDVVSPRIVVIEYNSLFGSERAVSIPYEPGFDRSEAHASWLYWGASIAALAHLGKSKGYRLLGSNKAGHNAFFVREDVAGGLEESAPTRAWRESRYRESRGHGGALTYVASHADRRRLISDMPVVDVTTGQMLRVREL